MNRLELIKEIHAHTIGERKNDVKKFETRLMNEQFEDTEKIFFDEWNKPENKIKGEQWHQFVRLATRFDEIQYMFHRIIDLLRRHKRSPHEYFKAKFQTGVSELPDRTSELSLLFTLSEEYFRIYKRIENRINFDRVRVTSSDITHGKINWDATLKKLNTNFPLHFETDDRKKKFNTSENILLVWIAMWLDNQIQRLLKTDFADPLDNEEIKNLNNISVNCKKIIKHFPFYEVIHDVLDFFTADIRDNKIKLLESNTRMRLKDGLIENFAYRDLLQWFNKIKSFDFPDLKKNDRTTNFLLDAVKNIDEMYEIWIFFELLHCFAKFCDVNLVLDSDPQYFQFETGYQNLMLFYEKEFEEGGQFSWAHKHVPDFTVIANDEIIAVFDAKNYRYKPDSDDSPINKILAYMTNLDTGYGAVFWPRNQEKEYTYPRSERGESVKYHSNLKVAVYSLDPYFKIQNHDALERTLEETFTEIKNRIKPSTKCPECYKIAISNEEIERVFGFRNTNGVSRPQSWCRGCRKMQLNTKP